LVRAKYGHPKGSPVTNPLLQLSIQCTPKWPISETRGATRSSVVVIFVVLVLRFSLSHSQKPQKALNLLVTEGRYWALFCMPLYTFMHILHKH
jgi:hypothetical protein